MSHRTAGRQRRPHPEPGQQALLAAATRRTRAPEPSGCADASTWLTGRDKDRVIRFDDVTAEDPDQTWALSTGDAYASARDMSVALGLCVDRCFDVSMELLHLAAAISDLAGCVNANYRAIGTRALVSLADDIAEQLADVPYPADLRVLMLAWHAEQAPADDEPLSLHDHRPLRATVGFDLETAVAA